jgi:TolA-binding protein
MSCKVDILQHREEQIKAADARAGTLQQQLDKLQAEITQRTEEIAKLKDTNTSQAERLEDAASMLSDKERLEDTVKKQVGCQ